MLTPVIKVMCDYCADGLWLNGAAVSAEIIPELEELEYLSIPPAPESLIHKISEWQELYEGFEFYDFRVDDKEIVSRPEYKKFLEMGPIITKEVRQWLPPEIEVVYFNEEEATFERIT